MEIMNANSKFVKILLFSTLLGTMGTTDGYSALFASNASISQQKGRVSGVVKDGMGPVVGASIVVKGTTNGTITDMDGKFIIDNVPAGAVLEISYVGMETQTIRWDGRSTVNVILKDEAQDLDEVVVVAYGTAKKSSFTGSASVVKSDQLGKISGTGFAEALQGMSAGVNVTNNEGNPGGDTRIQIRGIASMSGQSTPLIIVDGMPYDGSLNTIAPSDIESMTVLKDAAAASLYGSRAAKWCIGNYYEKRKSRKARDQFPRRMGNFRQCCKESYESKSLPTINKYVEGYL